MVGTAIAPVGGIVAAGAIVAGAVADSSGRVRGGKAKSKRAPRRTSHVQKPGGSIGKAKPEAQQQVRGVGEASPCQDADRQSVARVIEAVTDARDTLRSEEAYHRLLVAVFAVGMATANADGEVSPEEREDIKAFVDGIVDSELPPVVKGMVTRLRNHPPTFAAAMRHVSRAEPVDWDLLESVIRVVSRSDGRSTREEEALLQAFRGMRDVSSAAQALVPREAAPGDFEVVVAATMSSGKSTILNALIGKPLLPTKNEACTSSVFRIRDVDGLSGVRGRKAVGAGTPSQWQTVDRSTLELWNSASVEEIHVEGDFPHIANHGANLVLVDTPGPNNSLNRDHATATHHVLRNAGYRAVVYVINATQFGVDDERTLLEALHRELAAREKTADIVFAVNKVDSLDLEHESPSELVREVRLYLQSLGFRDPLVIPTMASLSLGIRSVLGSPGTRGTASLSERQQRRLLSDVRLVQEGEDAYLDALHSPGLGLGLHTPIGDARESRYSGQAKTVVLSGESLAVADLLHADILTGIPLLEEFLDKGVATRRCARRKVV